MTSEKNITVHSSDARKIHVKNAVEDDAARDFISRLRFIAHGIEIESLWVPMHIGEATVQYYVSMYRVAKLLLKYIHRFDAGDQFRIRCFCAVHQVRDVA